MSWLIDFFKELGDMIMSLIDFVITLVMSLFDFLANLPSFINILVSSFFTLPSSLVVFCSMSIVVSVIFLIIGRGKSN